MGLEYYLLLSIATMLVIDWKALQAYHQYYPIHAHGNMSLDLCLQDLLSLFKGISRKNSAENGD